MKDSHFVMSSTPPSPDSQLGSDRIDPAFAPLLADSRVALRRPPPNLAMVDLRRAANAFMAAAPRPAVAAVEELSAPGSVAPVPLRLYRPSDRRDLPLIVFVHGGGFLFGNLDTHDAMCRTLANESGAAVVAVDYRLSPEHPYPAPLHDCWNALAWLTCTAGLVGLDSDRIAIAGDSAGGQLAIATALLASTNGASLRHVGLLYPLIDPTCRSASITDFATGYVLTKSFLDWCWEAYGKSSANLSDPLFNLNLADLNGFPTTTIVTAGFDPLRDEGERFAHRLRDAGAQVQLQRYTGMIHGFGGLAHITPVANHAISFIARRLRASLILPVPR